MNIKTISTLRKAVFFKTFVLSLKKGHYNLIEIIEKKPYLFSLFLLEQERFDNLYAIDQIIKSPRWMIYI